LLHGLKIVFEIAMDTEIGVTRYVKAHENESEKIGCE